MQERRVRRVHDTIDGIQTGTERAVNAMHSSQGRAGGTGERFNLGEVTVTRCALRLGAADAPAGVAWVLGRDARRCGLAAVADALLQDPAQQDALDAALLTPVRQHLRQQATERTARAHSTRVDFFTMARESDGGADDEDEA